MELALDDRDSDHHRCIARLPRVLLVRFTLERFALAVIPWVWIRLVGAFRLPWTVFTGCHNEISVDEVSH